MKLEEVVKILNATVYCCEDKLDTEITSACASDMMSDVLAFLKDQSLLLSGLNNPQVIRTADMMDIKCVTLVRGKVPTNDMIDIATKKGIVLLSSNIRMYMACGLLFEKGLKAGETSI